MSNFYFGLIFPSFYITRCTRGVRVVFPEQECDPVTVLLCINLTLFKKLCSVHMPVFEIVAHQLDTTMRLIYLGADNSSIDCW